MQISIQLRELMKTNVNLQGLTESQMMEYSTVMDAILSKYDFTRDGGISYRKVLADNSKVLAYIMSIPNYPYSPATTTKAMEWIREHAVSIFDLCIEPNDQNQSNLGEWARTYYDNIISPQWTEADIKAWKGIKYCVKYDQTLIVAPTGKGSEYKVLGTDAREVYKMLSTIDYEGTSRLDYMRRTIISPLEEILYNTSGPLPSTAINPKVLSGAIAEVIYRHCQVHHEGVLVGYRFTTEKKPVLSDYITKAIEVFMSRPEYRIKDLTPISDDINEPTFCYIERPKSLRPKDELLKLIPAYVSFASSFENHSYSWPVFCAYNASVVRPKNRGKQALWLHGHGNDAKSKFINAWQYHLGDAATAIDVESMSNQFGMSRLEARRLCTISDNKNPDFIKKGWFHKASGGDVFDCERKNKTPYKAISVAKFMICENIAPNINLDEANQTSRVIYIKMRKRGIEEEIKMGLRKVFPDGSSAFIGNAQFEQDLIDQWPDFIEYCQYYYDTLCPNDANIALPTIMQDNIVEKCGDPLDQLLIEFLEARFEKDENGKTNKQDFLNIISEKYGDSWLKNGFNLKKIKTILTNVYQVEEKRENKGERYYAGIKIVEKVPFNSVKKMPQYKDTTKINMSEAHAIEIDSMFEGN